MSNNRIKLRRSPLEPQHEACLPGYRVLLSAHNTCDSFIQLFDAARSTRRRSTDRDQDLLRAMLVFASSGLDATIKELIANALPVVINAKEGNNGAALNFATYVERYLLRDPKLAAQIISRSLTSPISRQFVISWFQEQLSKDSLQSKEQIFQVASYFDIPSRELCTDSDSLHSAFKIRNKIIHEMDVDFNHSSRSRNPRNRDDIVNAANLILDTSEKFLREVDKRCG
ncbi:HEPN domain-containing protein [Hyphomicrobium sp.]|uniref:HEPN domain-containing protein n=1 Tax=Hyphomicrobium sp. TaxID=82 RepID=UPI002E379012|nr:HEPN domain-containing protein [Hyphomicrobium sp.]HEX2843262.1 HEPN domain-containing protein [Hyphomicrobium sp.]